jgi:hypothetical protein
MLIQDPSGSWDNIPGCIEEAVYGGLFEAEMDRIAGEAPMAFPSPSVTSLPDRK